MNCHVTAQNNIGDTNYSVVPKFRVSSQCTPDPVPRELPATPVSKLPLQTECLLPCDAASDLEAALRGVVAAPIRGWEGLSSPQTEPALWDVERSLSVGTSAHHGQRLLCSLACPLCCCFRYRQQCGQAAMRSHCHLPVPLSPPL